MTGDIRVGRSLTIPQAELEVRFAPSGGPGGQHANKAATRVELTWNIETSAVLGPRQRQKLRERLRKRIDGAGNLRVVVDTNRSQLRNREEAHQRLGSLVADALRHVPRRMKTEPTRASKERRLQAKRQRSATKEARKQPTLD